MGNEIILNKEQIREFANDTDIQNVILYTRNNWDEYCKFFMAEDKEKNGIGVYGIYIYSLIGYGNIRELYRWGKTGGKNE